MSNMRQQTFRRMVTRETGTPVSSSAVASAARRLCEHFAEQLTPMIGHAGVAAICARSLHLTDRHFRGRASVSAFAQEDSPFAVLQLSLEQMEPAAATEAAITVLVTASELLAAFIGSALTSNLLREAWPEDFAADTTEETVI